MVQRVSGGKVQLLWLTVVRH